MRNEAMMNDEIAMLKQQTKDRLNLTYEVSDEALESAARVNGAIKNYTLTFCSTPWTCPMPPRVSMGKPIPLNWGIEAAKRSQQI